MGAKLIPAEIMLLAAAVLFTLLTPCASLGPLPRRPLLTRLWLVGARFALLAAGLEVMQRAWDGPHTARKTAVMDGLLVLGSASSWQERPACSVTGADGARVSLQCKRPSALKGMSFRSMLGRDRNAGVRNPRLGTGTLQR